MAFLNIVQFLRIFAQIFSTNSENSSFSKDSDKANFNQDSLLSSECSQSTSTKNPLIGLSNLFGDETKEIIAAQELLKNHYEHFKSQTLGIISHQQILEALRVSSISLKNTYDLVYFLVTELSISNPTNKPTEPESQCFVHLEAQSINIGLSQNDFEFLQLFFTQLKCLSETVPEKNQIYSKLLINSLECLLKNCIQLIDFYIVLAKIFIEKKTIFFSRQKEEEDSNFIEIFKHKIIIFGKNLYCLFKAQIQLMNYLWEINRYTSITEEDNEDRSSLCSSSNDLIKKSKKYKICELRGFTPTKNQLLSIEGDSETLLYTNSISCLCRRINSRLTLKSIQQGPSIVPEGFLRKTLKLNETSKFALKKVNITSLRNRITRFFKFVENQMRKMREGNIATKQSSEHNRKLCDIQDLVKEQAIEDLMSVYISLQKILIETSGYSYSMRDLDMNACLEYVLLSIHQRIVQMNLRFIDLLDECKKNQLTDNLVTKTLNLKDVKIFLNNCFEEILVFLDQLHYKFFKKIDWKTTESRKVAKKHIDCLIESEMFVTL